MPEDTKKKELVDEKKKPPISSGRMVSEEDLINNIKKINKGAVSAEEGELLIPNEQILRLFMAEKLFDIDEKLGRMLEIFENAGSGKPTKTVAPNKSIDKPVAPSSLKEKVPTTPVSSRVTEIIDEFKKYGDALTVDTETSAQFVLIKPNRFLGGDTFAKVGASSKTLGGTYVSKGKESHFKIPKMVGKTPPKRETEKQVKDSELKSSPSSNPIQDLFPSKLAGLLNFEDVGDSIRISPKQFLGSENFSKIASIVRDAGGEYISAGKESHFKVLKPTQA